ncbi:MAG TPA: chemotaxis protein CheA [Solirubrobacteraceae bacterium]|nr:chemotaxis protein CheA [Solirubrobacteraceae bacterium]
MDTSEYMPMFLAETREHLEQLNLAIVKLEEDSTDRGTVEEIFRIAHSLKGMSATMGFANIAELTHHMEDVFELLRQRSGGLPSEAIDTVFACLDALSAATESIETDGQESLDPTQLVNRLRSLVRPRTAEQEMARYGGIDEPSRAAVQAARAAGARVLWVQVTLREDVMMPAVRAHMVLAALSDHGEVLGSVPAPDGLEQFQGREINAWVASDHEDEPIVHNVSDVSEVASVTVVDVTTPEAEEAQAPAPEPVAAAPAESAQDPAPEAAPTPAPAEPAPAAAPARAPEKPVDAQAKATRTVRVDAERLDALMHSMGELVIHRTAVEALTANLEVAGLQQAVQELTRSSQALQAMVMQVRMIPVDVVFLRFPRLIRDLSTKLGKEVKLELVGSDTELDRTVVDALGDPLVHLVRNAVDHGLELPDARVAAGKPRHGTIEIAARHAGGSVVIEVRDDGKGIDPHAVARKACSLGMIDEDTAAAIDMRGAVELLFSPGFSTAETTSDISGRGVGMDAVRAKIRQLGGEVLIDSTQGQGTLASIRLPLTLAIVSALQVDVSGAPFAIPLDRIERTLRLSEQTVRSVAGRPMLVLEDGVLALLDGAAVFGRETAGEHEFVVIIRAQDRRLALAVDDLVGQRELVTRPLPEIVSDGQPVSGGAALADGRIALIVDCDALAADKGITGGLTDPGGRSARPPLSLAA